MSWNFYTYVSLIKITFSRNLILKYSVIAKYRDLSVSRRSVICLSLRLRQIIDLLVTDKSRYFAQPRPIIVNYYHYFIIIIIIITSDTGKSQV